MEESLPKLKFFNKTWLSKAKPVASKDNIDISVDIHKVDDDNSKVEPFFSSEEDQKCFDCRNP